MIALPRHVHGLNVNLPRCWRHCDEILVVNVLSEVLPQDIRLNLVEEAHRRWLDLMANLLLLDFRAVEHDREENEELEDAEEETAVEEQNVVLAIPTFDFIETTLREKFT